MIKDTLKDEIFGCEINRKIKCFTVFFKQYQNPINSNLYNVIFRRNRSLSLSAADTWSGLSFTPLRSREHTSEAGSPTIEQVLLMNKSSQPRTSEASSADLGYGSLGNDLSSPGARGLSSRRCFFEGEPSSSSSS